MKQTVVPQKPSERQLVVTKQLLEEKKAISRNNGWILLRARYLFGYLVL
jgi:hypothetical protein